MKQFLFSRNKYGQELLMDIASNESITNYFFEPILHCTNFYEIICFEKGNGYLELDHQKIAIENNTIIFISPFQNRKWFVDKTDIKCHFLLFKSDFLSSFFSDRLFTYKLQYFYNKTNPLFITISNAQREQFESIFEELILELKGLRADSEHVIRSLLYFVLIKFNRLYIQMHQLLDEPSNHIISIMFKQLLQKEVKNNRAIGFYTDQLGVSKVTLAKCVKKQFGITPTEMINEFLLAEVKTLLLSTPLNISQISAIVNFSEPNHLSRFFKRHTNFTPQDYRKIGR